MTRRRTLWRDAVTVLGPLVLAAVVVVVLSLLVFTAAAA